MLTVLAKTFMTATRTDTLDTREAQKPSQRNKNWLPKGHWWIEQTGDDTLNTRPQSRF